MFTTIKCESPSQPCEAPTTIKVCFYSHDEVFPYPRDLPGCPLGDLGCPRGAFGLPAGARGILGYPGSPQNPKIAPGFVGVFWGPVALAGPPWATWNAQNPPGFTGSPSGPKIHQNPPPGSKIPRGAPESTAGPRSSPTGPQNCPLVYLLKFYPRASLPCQILWFSTSRDFETAMPPSNCAKARVAPFCNSLLLN